MDNERLNEQEIKDLLGVPYDWDIAIVTITPEIAQIILEFNNTRNRKLSEKRVSEMVRKFKSEEYFLSTVCIGFDAEGTLVDGQHRLSAMAKLDEEYSFEIGVMFNVKQSLDMDTGKTRTLRDNAMLADEVDERFKESDNAVCLDIIKSVISFRSGLYNNATFSQSTIVKIANEFADDLIYCRENGIFERTKGGASSSVVLAAFFVAYESGVSISKLKYIKEKMKSQLFDKETDRPISGCLIRLGSIIGGGGEVATLKYNLVQDCIYRVDKGRVGNTYPKSYSGKRARYIIDVPYIN